MTGIEILEVVRTAFDRTRNHGGSLDSPATGTRRDGYAIGLQGWALAALGRPAVVEIISNGEVLATVSTGEHRRDVGLALPDVVDAAYSGFALTVSALDLPPAFELHVQIVVNDRERLPFAVVRGRRSVLPPDPGVGPQPIMITTLGRTGSSAVALLLGAHPDVVCHGAFPFETRVAAYWMSVFAALSTPRSTLQPVISNGQDYYWWLGDPTLPVHSYIGRNPAIDWLGGENLDALAASCRDRITAFYAWHMRVSGRAHARYFVEKHLPHPRTQDRLWELYPNAREVVLVRDPRDMVASILAFNQKRQTVAFGRAIAKSDEDYVSLLRASLSELEYAWTRRLTRAHLLRYEDLMLRPGPTLTALFTYLGVDASAAMVDAVQRRATTMDPARQDEHRTVSDPSKTVGRWQQDLAPGVRAAAETVFDRALRLFGYRDSPAHLPRANTA